MLSEKRISLEQLKAMSDRELGNVWLRGKFPFDWPQTCDACMTQHTHDYITCHREFAEETIKVLGRNIWVPSGLDVIRTHLDELYALRLFYDGLYPPSTEEQAFARMEESEWDSRANTR